MAYDGLGHWVAVFLEDSQWADHFNSYKTALLELTYSNTCWSWAMRMLSTAQECYRSCSQYPADLMLSMSWSSAVGACPLFGDPCFPGVWIVLLSCCTQLPLVTGYSEDWALALSLRCSSFGMTESGMSPGTHRPMRINGMEMPPSPGDGGSRSLALDDGRELCASIMMTSQRLAMTLATLLLLTPVLLFAILDDQLGGWKQATTQIVWNVTDVSVPI